MITFGDGEHFPAAESVHGSTCARSHHCRDHERGGESGEEPCARHPELLGDGIGKNGGEIVARCPSEGLRGSEREDYAQAVVRNHARVAEWSCTRDRARAYQRDISSMATQVMIEQPNSAYSETCQPS